MPSEQTAYQRLRDFYQDEFRPVYDRFSANGNIPQEIHAELAAAFDHLLRFADDDPTRIADSEVDRVIGHVKRATFDAFKLTLRDEIKRAYAFLLARRFAGVHDGKFHAEINAMWNRARDIAREARRLESLSGKIDTDGWNRAFAKWNEILPIADAFSKLMESEEVARARAQSRMAIVIQVVWGIALAVLGVVLGKLF